MVLGNNASFNAERVPQGKMKTKNRKSGEIVPVKMGKRIQKEFDFWVIESLFQIVSYVGI